MKCAVCKREIPEGKDSCECGNRILKCKKCGHDVLPNETRCSQCNVKCKRVTNKDVWGGFFMYIGVVFACILAALLQYGKIESPWNMESLPITLLVPVLIFLVTPSAMLWEETINVQKASVITYYIGSKELNRNLTRFYLIMAFTCLMVVGLYYRGSFITWSAPCRVADKFLGAKDAEVRQSYLAPDVRENLMKRIQQAQKKNPDFLANAPRVEGAKFFDGGEARVKLADSTLQYIELKKIGDQWLITDIEGLPILDYGL